MASTPCYPHAFYPIVPVYFTDDAIQSYPVPYIVESSQPISSPEILSQYQTSLSEIILTQDIPAAGQTAKLQISRDGMVSFQFIHPDIQEHEKQYNFLSEMNLL